ncbi:MAG: SpoIIIAH-like family protein, partial [Bacilli bacterium]
MKLKKQTVWLLTMLSLVVVLSVYYVWSPNVNDNPLTFEFPGGKEQAQDPSVETGANEEATTEGTKTEGTEPAKQEQGNAEEGAGDKQGATEPNKDGGSEKPAADNTEKQGDKPAEEKKTGSVEQNALSKATQFLAQLRLNVEDERSAQKEELEATVANASVSAEDKNRAFEQISKINNVTSK